MSSQHGHISLATYTIVFILLLVLLVVTVGVAYIELGAWGLPVAMLVATCKALLIVYYFMHLKVSSRWMAIFFFSSVYILLVGGILLFTDYTLRS